MSLSQIRINGIRLSPSLSHLLEQPAQGDPGLCPPLYQTLAEEETNIVCLGLRNDASGTSVFCCHESRDGNDKPSSNVCMVSVYPHHSSLNTLGFLIGLFGKHQILFQQMVSSNAMISFVIDGADQNQVLTLLEQEFDLPPTHTPFQQNFNDETAAFVKKRYPETSATYVEEKIKTYGIQLTAGLEMLEISLNPNQPEHLEICGKGFQNLAKAQEKFYFTAAMTRGKNACSLFCLTDPVAEPDYQFFSSKVKGVNNPILCGSVSVDLISFHGPHFGDRFGIFNTAMACLKAASIEVLLAGCTGASICMVLPATLGEKAISALAKGFETP